MGSLIHCWQNLICHVPMYQLIWVKWPTEGHHCKKMLCVWIGNFHHKDNTVVRLSYLYNGNTSSGNIETGPWFPGCTNNPSALIQTVTVTGINNIITPGWGSLILTHWGLVMPYGDIDLGQHWLRWWLVAWRQQAITWINVDLSSVRSSNILLMTISQEIPQPSVTRFMVHCRPAITQSMFSKILVTDTHSSIVCARYAFCSFVNSMSDLGFTFLIAMMCFILS